MTIPDKQWDDLRQKVDETHDAMVRLTAVFNGGPGHWEACRVHSQAQMDHEERLRRLEKKMFAAIGGVGLISLAGTVVGIWAALHK